MAHVIAVDTPLAFVDIKTGVHPGDGLRDFSRADRRGRAQSITLTVTQVFDRYVEVLFSGFGDRPGVGDLVEPIARGDALRETTTAPSPVPSKSPSKS